MKVLILCIYCIKYFTAKSLGTVHTVASIKIGTMLRKSLNVK